MSGHNKWSQIKVKKGAEDAKRSKLFSMLVRGITMEAKKARSNREAPHRMMRDEAPGLKAIIQRAKDANMPSDNIERAVQKGFGGEADNFEEVIYEAYGPAGTALIIVGITDNKNRTTSEIKHLLSQNGGSLGGIGSTTWTFDKQADGNFVAQNLIPLFNEEEKNKLLNLIEKLEEYEDIKIIYHNADLC